MLFLMMIKKNKASHRRPKTVNPGKQQERQQQHHLSVTTVNRNQQGVLTMAVA